MRRSTGLSASRETCALCRPWIGVNLKKLSLGLIFEEPEVKGEPPQAQADAVGREWGTEGLAD
jgi:hypothetical protein